MCLHSSSYQTRTGRDGLRGLREDLAVKEGVEGSGRGLLLEGELRGGSRTDRLVRRSLERSGGVNDLGGCRMHNKQTNIQVAMCYILSTVYMYMYVEIKFCWHFIS